MQGRGWQPGPLWQEGVRGGVYNRGPPVPLQSLQSSFRQGPRGSCGAVPVGAPHAPSPPIGWLYWHANEGARHFRRQIKRHFLFLAELGGGDGVARGWARAEAGVPPSGAEAGAGAGPRRAAAPRREAAGDAAAALRAPSGRYDPGPVPRRRPRPCPAQARGVRTAAPPRPAHSPRPPHEARDALPARGWRPGWRPSPSASRGRRGCRRGGGRGVGRAERGGGARGGRWPGRPPGASPRRRAPGAWAGSSREWPPRSAVRGRGAAVGLGPGQGGARAGGCAQADAG